MKYLTSMGGWDLCIIFPQQMLPYYERAKADNIYEIYFQAIFFCKDQVWSSIKREN